MISSTEPLIYQYQIKYPTDSNPALKVDNEHFYVPGPLLNSQPRTLFNASPKEIHGTKTFGSDDEKTVNSELTLRAHSLITKAAKCLHNVPKSFVPSNKTNIQKTRKNRLMAAKYKTYMNKCRAKSNIKSLDQDLLKRLNHKESFKK
ncbi:hypothetical protein Ciccas_002222 [Cichlidogyrus casuarinus]|uniref:Uncharacterized protein n=1 Tax=Cichlidogyrus casuarinus TaxID=1844966 RepID=A0ABD2QHW3_9PLAT